MAERQANGSKENEKKRPDFGSLIMLGLVCGAAVGLVFFENAGIGTVAGLLTATVVNAYFERKENAKGAGVALAISLVAIAVFVGILIVF